MPTGGDVGPGKRGFSLGESGNRASRRTSTIYFRGTLIAALAPDNDSIGVEEAYIQTLGLSHGFSIKAGRFFSASAT